MSTIHQAWRLHSYGGPECLSLDTIPRPVPAPTQALISISAAGLNPFDWKIREGYVRDQLPLVLPMTLGVDFVGTIVSFGSAHDPSTSPLKIGDRVITMSRSLGAFAEYIAVETSILARVPPQLDDAAAATIPIPALTAWQSLRAAGEVKPGMKVLIHGASGIVGAFATQFAKAKGAYVVGTASGKNREYVMGLGADEFVDYQTENFEDKVRDFDLVLDYVLVGGSRGTTDRSWGVLKEGGAIVSVADPAILGKIPEGKRGYFPDIVPDVGAMEEIAREIEQGRVKSKVARVFAKGELVEGMEINKSGGTTGRLVVDFKTV